MAERDVFKGFLLGIAAVALVPVVRRALGERGESLGRAASRAAGAVGEKAREIVAEFAEIAEDTIVELQRHDSPEESDAQTDAQSDGAIAGASAGGESVESTST